MKESIISEPVSYVCPVCKCQLRPVYNALYCNECNQTYPFISGIPDFTVGKLKQRRFDESWLRAAHRKFFDFLAPIYESWIWYQLTLNLSGARESSIQSIANFVSESLNSVTGNVLDVACGPATYGRRIVSPSRNIYGVDISIGMLRQGMNYIRRDHIQGVYIARARAEELPFEDAFFDGAICAGSLHLFSDASVALREIARTMKPDTPLAIQTFTPLSSNSKHSLKKRSGVHLFDASEVQKYLTEAGFEIISSKLIGTVLTIKVQKAIHDS
jgi:SAM-dependent methyltransferase